MKSKLVGIDVHPFSKKLEFRGYKQKEICPCLLATDYKAPKTILLEVVEDSGFPKIAASRGRYGADGTIHQQLEINERGISNTLTTVQKDNYVLEEFRIDKQNQKFRIRKLTAKETWRLMGFTDIDFHKAESVNSNTQLYKQSGNAIVVDVLEGIFGSMFEDLLPENVA